MTTAIRIGVAVLLCSSFLLLAPGCPKPTPTESTGTSSIGAFETPPDSPAAAVPATLRVLNDTDEQLTFSTTFGPHEPFGISRLDGPLDPTSSLGGCWCECGGPPCPDAARPETEVVTLEPGEFHEFSWPGRLERHDRHPRTGNCCVRFDPPPGRYVFTACTEDLRCGRAEASLPTSETVTVPMSAIAKATSCAELNLEVAGRVAGHFKETLESVLRDRQLHACPATPRCVEHDDLESELAAARSRPCSIFVVPRGDEVEVRVFLPLPRTHVGGESYSRFVDPDFSRVFRVRYEQ